MTTKTLLTPLLFIALAFAVPAQASTPTGDLKTATDEVVAALKSSSLDAAAKRKQIHDAVYARFDFWAMSQSVLATNWKKATKEQKLRFKDLFGQLLEKTYYSAVAAYDNQTIEFGKEVIKGKRATVDTFIVSESQKIPVNYRMRLKKGRWYVYDVKVEGVSLVSNYRSTFKSIFANEGMEGVLASMEKKLREGGEG
jgi:phospholipid transport system substrate-binding protein